MLYISDLSDKKLFIVLSVNKRKVNYVDEDEDEDDFGEIFFVKIIN